MEVKIEPNCLKAEGSQISGHCVIEVPKFSQRWEYIEKSGFKMNAEGAVDSALENLGSIIKVVGFTKPHYKEVAFVAKDGKEFKSFEDLENDSRCDAILFEVASLFVKGFTPSKN